MKETLRYGFILGLICLLSSSVLAVVNGVTEPMIKLQIEQAENSALKEVIPQAVSFQANLVDGKTIYYRAYDKENHLIGFAVKSEGKGYSSNIETLTGLDLNLDITEIKILQQNETPGLGNRVKDTSFQEQFKRKNLNSLDQVQAITGATISSTAVIDSIKAKIAELKEQLLEEVKNAK